MRTRRQTGPNPMHERWQREDAAPRLADAVPDLTQLTLDFVERTGSSALGATRHRSIVPVASAGAHFEVPCNDGDCELGGHDLTTEILRGLSGHRASFTGEHACRGTTKVGPCERVLEYTVHATYKK